jgi:hypothetical protein
MPRRQGPVFTSRAGGALPRPGGLGNTTAPGNLRAASSGGPLRRTTTSRLVGRATGDEATCCPGRRARPDGTPLPGPGAKRAVSSTGPGWPATRRGGATRPRSGLPSPPTPPGTRRPVSAAAESRRTVWSAGPRWSTVSSSRPRVPTPRGGRTPTRWLGRNGPESSTTSPPAGRGSVSSARISSRPVSSTGSLRPTISPPPGHLPFHSNIVLAVLTPWPVLRKVPGHGYR